MKERKYTSDEAEQLKGKMVVCDESSCDGKPCGGYHNKPHIYIDEECYHNCEWPGHNGFCVPVENKG
jgi:hypothetical protein